MKINKLLNKPDAGIYKGRCTGRSTGLALMYISNAIQNPGKDVYIRDHHGTPQADDFLFGTVRDMVSRLGLECMVFSKRSYTIRFDLYEESDEFIEVDGVLYKRV